MFLVVHKDLASPSENPNRASRIRTIHKGGCGRAGPTVRGEAERPRRQHGIEGEGGKLTPASFRTHDKATAVASGGSQRSKGSRVGPRRPFVEGLGNKWTSLREITRLDPDLTPLAKSSVSITDNSLASVNSQPWFIKTRAATAKLVSRWVLWQTVSGQAGEGGSVLDPPSSFTSNKWTAVTFGVNLWGNRDPGTVHTIHATLGKSKIIPN